MNTAGFEVSRYFDNLASVWDNGTKPDQDRIKTILSIACIKEGDRVLDVGSGTGILLPYLSWNVGVAGSVLAVDYSSGMLNVSQEKNSVLPNVSFRQVNVETESLPGHFDHIVMFNMFPHLRHPFTALRKLVERNLTADGNLLLFHSMNRQELNEIHSKRFGDGEYFELPAIDRLAERIRQDGMRTSNLVDDELGYGLLVSRGARCYTIGA